MKHSIHGLVNIRVLVEVRVKCKVLLGRFDIAIEVKENRIKGRTQHLNDIKNETCGIQGVTIEVEGSLTSSAAAGFV